jgi:hypothetical protein
LIVFVASPRPSHTPRNCWPTACQQQAVCACANVLPVYFQCAAVGYRVLSVQQNSPASNVTIIHNGIRQLTTEERIKGQSLVAFFDFIISINGHRLVRYRIAVYAARCRRSRLLAGGHPEHRERKKVLRRLGGRPARQPTWSAAGRRCTADCSLTCIARSEHGAVVQAVSPVTLLCALRNGLACGW